MYISRPSVYILVKNFSSYIRLFICKLFKGTLYLIVFEEKNEGGSLMMESLLVEGEIDCQSQP